MGVHQGETIFWNVTGLRFPLKYGKISYIQAENFSSEEKWRALSGTYLDVLMKTIDCKSYMEKLCIIFDSNFLKTNLSPFPIQMWYQNVCYDVFNPF